MLLSCENKNAQVAETQTNVTANVDSLQLAETSVSTGQATEVTAETSARPALNPAHGEPYHRCDIQVGAPIDSAPEPSAPQLTPSPQVSGFNTSPIAPSVTSSAAPAAISGPKPALNPAHGEPYHRCDLQVGAPLT